MLSLHFFWRFEICVLAHVRYRFEICDVLKYAYSLMCAITSVRVHTHSHTKNTHTHAHKHTHVHTSTHSPAAGVQQQPQRGTHTQIHSTYIELHPTRLQVTSNSHASLREEPALAHTHTHSHTHTNTHTQDQQHAPWRLHVSRSQRQVLDTLESMGCVGMEVRKREKRLWSVFRTSYR
jgi:hypothetical protein